MPDDKILPLAFDQALSERYLNYALSTITARSLPDVRDGLKPVHRRLVYAMRELRLGPDTAPKKSARVVGDVIGKYHPHGDQAVYDALVRLAQDFAARYPLVDGQGNFGNIDGDGAAAMRYTEARLTDVAELLLAGIDEDAIDFRTTYDEEGKEPVVLPAAFPNLLANGAQGIAVGMATSIPPHNVAELCAALILLLKKPGASIADLMEHVRGPDLPTGGILVEPVEAMEEAYSTGRGSFRLRARWESEKLGQGQYQIVVTEIPYQVQKAKLIERIAELLQTKKLTLLADVRDESAEDVRLILEPKSRNVDPELLMEQMFRATDLETRVSLNLNVLDSTQTPKVMSLKEALVAFLDHRIEVLQRQKRHRLTKIEHRLEVLAGYLIAFLNIDEVIRIIREEDEVKPALMARFSLTDVQAEAILNMRLRALRKLEEIELRAEHAALEEEKAEVIDLLEDPKKQKKLISADLASVAKTFGPDHPFGSRRTEIAGAPPVVDVPVEAFIEREAITVLLSKKGWVRAVRGHQEDVSDVKYKDGDGEGFVLHCETTDRLLLFATNGRCYTMAADKLPRGRGFGEPVRLSIDLPNDASILYLTRYQEELTLLVASGDGRGFQVKAENLIGQTKTGRQVLSVPKGGAAVGVTEVNGDMVAVLSTGRKLNCFALSELPEMAKGRGVILQRYRDASLADVAVFTREDGLSWGHRTLAEPELSEYVGRRAAAGRLPPKGFPKNLKF
ncbi:MAG: DNA topoisomerase IV subunit A [Pseudomonadota bacterium]